MAALVCKAWRFEAQSLLLWKELYVRSENQASGLIRSPSFGSFTTEKLAIDGGEISDASVYTLVEGVVNVQHLSLYRYALGLLLRSPNLKGAFSMVLVVWYTLAEVSYLTPQD